MNATNFRTIVAIFICHKLTKQFELKYSINFALTIEADVVLFKSETFLFNHEDTNQINWVWCIWNIL